MISSEMHRRSLVMGLLTWLRKLSFHTQVNDDTSISVNVDDTWLKITVEVDLERGP